MSTENRPATSINASENVDKFLFFNKKTKLLHETTKRLVPLLADSDVEEKSSTSAGPNLDTDIEGHFDMIRGLPLFRNVSRDVLREMLRAARLVHHDRNSVFVAQGESLSRALIILDGWAKIYKSTPEDEESILHILGRREGLIDTDILHPAPSPFSAKAVTKIKLLSLPASILREQASLNRELALNLLALGARRMQRLMSQFEQITLRPAMHRVGWFLLNLCLETGIGGPPIVLPFDKALIAAYLGIKPETFSRLLQEFRDLGFRVERRQIALPDPFALCSFCDAETLAKCDLAGTDSCPRAEKPATRSGS